MLDGAVVSRVTAMLPVALLSALVAVQTFTAGGGGLTLDARARVSRSRYPLCCCVRRSWSW